MARAQSGNSTEDGGRSATVQSVDRALLVMEILATLGQAGVTEIAAELGVHKSTVSRLISALEARGYVEQLSDRGKYRLGFAIARLARSTSAQLDLVKQSQPACDALALESGETTNLAVLDGDRIVNIAEAIGPAGIALRTWVGQSCAAHTTSSGKVLLAALDRAELRERLGTRLESFTDHTLTTRAALEAELDVVRKQGWASVREELEVGLNAVAAPVYDADAQVVAALSVSGPSYRLGEDAFESTAKRTIAAAESISRRLGWIDLSVRP
jgi:DNA-binding IclR family transcriptional regulator